MPSVSIVVPVYHNAASLPELCARFRALADRHSGDRFEFVFVDDGSKDDSLTVLAELQVSEPRMRVLKLSRNFGSNAAIRAGLEAATGGSADASSALTRSAWLPGRSSQFAMGRKRGRMCVVNGSSAVCRSVLGCSRCGRSDTTRQGDRSM